MTRVAQATCMVQSPAILPPHELSIAAINARACGEGWQWYDDAALLILRRVAAEFPAMRGCECGAWYREGPGHDEHGKPLLTFRLGVATFGCFDLSIPSGIDAATSAELDRGLTLCIRRKFLEWSRRLGLARKPVRKFKRRGRR